MKHAVILFASLLLAGNSFAQKGFGIDGTIGFGQNGGEPVYPMLLEGRIQWNRFFSTNLGIGLWNFGLKDHWQQEGSETVSCFDLNSNKTLPSLQLGVRSQWPVFNCKKGSVRVFLEPKLYFLPFSAQTLHLTKIVYRVETHEQNEKTYVKDGDPKTSNLKSECHPRLYGGVQAGIHVPLTESIDLTIGYGYTHIDLFKDLRNKFIKDTSENEWPLNESLPRVGLHTLSLGFLINFDLN